jgi:ELWxxDGT repeat protein
VLFSAATPSAERELWRTDAAGTGTTLVADHVPGAALSDPGPFAARAGAVYFAAGEGIHRRLWTTDGTAAGTVSYAKSGPSELWRVDDAGRAAKLLEGFGRFVGEVASGLISTGGARSGTGSPSGGCGAAPPGAASAGWLATLAIASGWPRRRRGLCFERLDCRVNGRPHAC